MKNKVANYDDVLLLIERSFFDVDFYWQSLSLLFCFATSYLFYRHLRNFIFVNKISVLKKNTRIYFFLKYYLDPLLFSISCLAVISLWILIYSQFFKHFMLLSVTLKLLCVFVILRFIRISSNSAFISNLIGIFLIPAMILDSVNILSLIINNLDQLSLKIGVIRISVYLVIKAILVIIIAFWFSSLVRKKSRSYIDNNENIELNTKSIITKVIDIFVYSILLIILLKTFGVDMTTFAVFGGAIGVGIGFGLQKIASNFISGIILLFEKSIKIGDWVEIDNGAIFGIVKHFGGRHTIIECFDGKEVMIPNEDFIVGKVKNWTHSNNRVQVEFSIGVSYDSDLDLVRKIIIDSMKSNSKCATYPEVECYLVGFFDNDIKFTSYFWINDVTQGRMLIKSEILMEIWKRFKENKITIPSPRMEVKIIDKK
jgi:small-conductance mechanosensitive channel